MKILIAALLLIAGCALPPAYLAKEVSSTSVLTVTNQRTNQVTVYVVRAGQTGRRLGEVNSLGSATFMLTRADAPPAADVQFLAKSNLTGVVEISDPIPARKGAAYEWRLAPMRGNQYLTLR